MTTATGFVVAASACFSYGQRGDVNGKAWPTEGYMLTLAILGKALYLSWVLSEIGILILTRTTSGGGEIKDRGSLLILWVTMIASINLGTRFGDSHALVMSGEVEWGRYVSLACMIFGLAIRWTAVASLGRSFSANVAIHAEQQLSTTGLYRFVRHPSYFGLLLVLVAIGLHTRDWIGFAIVVLPPLAALGYRIHVEEQALRTAFGPVYTVYAGRTKRLLPGLY
jgi:protein-S-isoprenylcysteine O-methyltransferase Ste14